MNILKRRSHRTFLIASFLAPPFPRYFISANSLAAAFTHASRPLISHVHVIHPDSGVNMKPRSKTSPFFAKKRVGEEKPPPQKKLRRGNATHTQNRRVKREGTCAQNGETDSESKAVEVSKKAKTETERTQSFDAQWHGSFVPNTTVKVHTLVLGTHPSIASLAKVQYFGHPMNAFWWIAGDCLGFRRLSAISPSTGKPYKLASSLYHGEDKVIPYDEQLQLFTSKGFALWDIIASCERPGSLDVDIKEEKPNNIREFCKHHPNIRRIVMVNGGQQSTFFAKLFEDWWLSGELKPGSNDISQKAFRKFAKKTNNFEKGSIEIISLPSVSPAAASISYEDKRDAYSKYCYAPGLLDHEQLSK